jgi:hypothetical protein
LIAVVARCRFGGHSCRRKGVPIAADIADLLRLSDDQLDDLFRKSEAGEIPDGEAEGTVLAGPAAKLVHYLVWKGKVFSREKGELLNEVGPFGFNAVRAKVYKDDSWLDGKETIVLDYSDTSLIAHWIRDEIRLVGPGTYLGLVYWEKAKILHFALKFPT